MRPRSRPGDVWTSRRDGLQIIDDVLGLGDPATLGSLWVRIVERKFTLPFLLAPEGADSIRGRQPPSGRPVLEGEAFAEILAPGIWTSNPLPGAARDQARKALEALDCLPREGPQDLQLPGVLTRRIAEADRPQTAYGPTLRDHTSSRAGKE